MDAPHPDPFELLASWYADAVATELPLPEAVTLATATPDGRPSARVVLYKGHDERGLRFYTNYSSRKARELDANPYAALAFHWQPLSRQLRIEGAVERLAAGESDAYFASRPRGSQIAAVASPQSEEIADRDALMARFRELEARYGDAPIPRPDGWGGYRLLPEAFEFWSGRDHRLHDRIAYRRSGSGWTISRLAP